MKKIKRLKLSKKDYVKNSELLPQLYAKQCELIDFANKHQEEHEGLLDAIKTVYAPEIEGKIFSSGSGTDQPEETKAGKDTGDRTTGNSNVFIETYKNLPSKTQKMAEWLYDNGYLGYVSEKDAKIMLEKNIRFAEFLETL